MHSKVKVLIAHWLARHIETRARRLRRALRDLQRAESRRIHAADRRARGLRLYAAWSVKEKAATDYGRIVPLEPPSHVEQQALTRRVDLKMALAELDALAKSLGLTNATRLVNAFELAGIGAFHFASRRAPPTTTPGCRR